MCLKGFFTSLFRYTRDVSLNLVLMEDATKTTRDLSKSVFISSHHQIRNRGSVWLGNVKLRGNLMIRGNHLSRKMIAKKITFTVFG